jgi:hypothetical protein
MKYLVFADSINRNTNADRHANNYTLYLSTPIKNIKQVDLVSLHVPNTMYNITNGSNVLTIGFSNISINEGFYSAGGIASTITAAVNNAFTINYLSNEGKFLFSNTTQFSFKTNTQDLALMLGLFPFQTYNSAPATNLDPCYLGEQIVRSLNVIDMNKNEYIFLDIDEFKTPKHIDAKGLSGNTGTIAGRNINRAFAPIMMDVSSGDIKTHTENSDYTISVTYPEPIASLQRLTIKWYDTTNRILDFRGANKHAFLLRIHTIDEDERRLPPPPPLQDVEIKRIVEAMTMVPPPPPEKKTKIPWLIIVLVLIAVFAAWKTLSGQSLRTQAAGAR